MKVTYHLRTKVDGEEILIPISAEEAKAEHQTSPQKAISHINKIRKKHGYKATTYNSEFPDQE